MCATTYRNRLARIVAVNRSHPYRLTNSAPSNSRIRGPVTPPTTTTGSAICAHNSPLHHASGPIEAYLAREVTRHAVRSSRSIVGRIALDTKAAAVVDQRPDRAARVEAASGRR